jgi:prepilin-type processing-associated H-X9-DG protein
MVCVRVGDVCVCSELNYELNVAQLDGHVMVCGNW